MIQVTTEAIPEFATTSASPIGVGEMANVGQSERWFSALSGAALVEWGLWRGHQGPMARILALLGGGMLISRGLSGYCPLYRALGYSSRRPSGPHIDMPTP